MLLANKFFDLVIGVDFHATASPPFNPIHPFIGFTLDISAYIPFIGATTFINKVPYGNSGTMGTLGTKAHIPLVGGFVMAPMIANESTNFFGSMNTFVEGMRLSGAGFMVMSCNDVGLPLSMQPGTKGKKFKPSLFAPTSVTIPIPKGSPVMVGGPYIPDLTAVLKSLAMGFGMGCLMKGLGGSAKKIAKLANAKNKQARDLMSGIVNDVKLPKGEIIKKNLANDVIDLTPGSKGGWNKALNGKLKPNAKYKVGDKIYDTDNLGRVSKVSGKLELGKLGRNNYQQGKSVKLKDGTKGIDQGGHLIGHQFKGAGEQINYVPMKGDLNQGAWKQMETKWAKALSEVPPKAVEVNITNIYKGHSSKPSSFKVIYKIDGKTTVKIFPNN